MMSSLAGSRIRPWQSWAYVIPRCLRWIASVGEELSETPLILAKLPLG